MFCYIRELTHKINPPLPFLRSLTGSKEREALRSEIYLQISIIRILQEIERRMGI